MCGAAVDGKRRKKEKILERNLIMFVRKCWKINLVVSRIFPSSDVLFFIFVLARLPLGLN